MEAAFQRRPREEAPVNRAWPRLCAAIVDRLTFGGNIIEIGTTSYRLAHTLAHRAADATP